MKARPRRLVILTVTLIALMGGVVCAGPAAAISAEHGSWGAVHGHEHDSAQVEARACHPREGTVPTHGAVLPAVAASTPVAPTASRAPSIEGSRAAAMVWQPPRLFLRHAALLI